MRKAKIAGVYLAAGTSERMDRDKLLLPFGGECLGSNALKAALHSKLDHIFVVTKPGDPLAWLSPSFFLRPYAEKWSHVPCRHHSEGQAGSLRCGLQRAEAFDADGAMILLADQPFITGDVIDELLSLFRKKPFLYFVASCYEDIPRPPVLFSKKVFPVLMKLRGDEGARQIIRNKGRNAGKLKSYSNPLYFMDVDTPADYDLARCHAAKMNEEEGR
ncbi:MULTISPECIES: NTP transferase domain-containing protein [Bacillus]|uniref:Xanthine dehydrogenase n=1 Tax=Bacillus glycinifermentans TaxID=1664069 RepID=A0AAJ3Z0M6_9BACI|nr:MULTISPECIES: NTP transferase domain-containing protein [Bacillus]KKB74360.1 hypothetical protein TH62_07320 [Bacillus sp. TH008]MDU0073242.1 NTP transferase domain-containing protein [Bacillus sp. IG6]MED8021213.1 NTP transferase domain-containing protein [Bacillus glycinifermentans]QAT66799.1 xanthine dehydrogenase [Bacillus glycinifermentans]WKB76552.1 NTP transferase domain-containing protein [Bacillus glycinifermentans]